MIKGLRITFDSLERFDGAVSIDVSGPLTAIVGPNGSGKSTILEAVAEVMTFLRRYPLEAPIEEVRKLIHTQRSARPSWARATVKADFDDSVTLAISDSLFKHLGEPRKGGQVSVTIAKPPGRSQRWAVESVAYGGDVLAFDTKGDLVVDSIRYREAKVALNKLETEHSTKIAGIREKIETLKNNARNQALVQNLSVELAQAQAEQNAPEVAARRQQLAQEIQHAKTSAVPLAGGGEVPNTTAGRPPGPPPLSRDSRAGSCRLSLA